MSEVDRRVWDPWAPPPAPMPKPEPQTCVDEPPAEVGPGHGEDEFRGLAQMKRADMVALAAKHGLDTSGTREDLLDRLRDYRDQL